jgi:hypothetical protein
VPPLHRWCPVMLILIMCACNFWSMLLCRTLGMRKRQQQRGVY